MSERCGQLRVLVVARPSPVWGAELRLLATAPELRRRGVVLVLAVEPGNEFSRRWLESGFELAAVRAPSAGAIRRAGGGGGGPPPPPAGRGGGGGPPRPPAARCARRACVRPLHLTPPPV